MDKLLQSQADTHTLSKQERPKIFTRIKQEETDLWITREKTRGGSCGNCCGERKLLLKGTQRVNNERHRKGGSTTVVCFLLLFPPSLARAQTPSTCQPVDLSVFLSVFFGFPPSFSCPLFPLSTHGKHNFFFSFVRFFMLDQTRPVRIKSHARISATNGDNGS